MTKQALTKKLQMIIYDYLNFLPNEIKEQISDLWFVFDENSICQVKDLVAFATHEPTTRTITFYLDLIQKSKFDDKRLKELVVHEYGHACGMTEEQVATVMDKYIKKNAKI